MLLLSLLFLLLGPSSLSSASVLFTSSELDNGSFFMTDHNNVPESTELVAAHFQSEIFSQKASKNFECGLVRQHVRLSERQRILERQFKTKIQILPISNDRSIKKVFIPKAYVMLPPFYKSHFKDQNETAHVVDTLFPFFYAIDPAWYDGYEYGPIPVEAAYLVRIDRPDQPMLFPSATIADINKERERIMRERFCRPAWPPRISKQQTIPFQLTLPLVSKEAPFHPTTFSHPLWDLGDVLKVLFLVASRDGVPYHKLMSQVVPSLHFLSLRSENALPMDGKAHFTRIVAGQPFRLIRKGDCLVHIQSFHTLFSLSTVLPSLQPVPANTSLVILHKVDGLIEPSVEVVAQVVQFLPLCRQHPNCEKVLENYATNASKVQLEVQIPEGTPDRYRMIAALTALRRMNIPAEALPSLQRSIGS